MKKILCILVLFAIVSGNATTFVAILETVVDSSLNDVISMPDRIYLTDALRSEATNELSNQGGFAVMSREDVELMLPTSSASEVGSGNYIVEVGDSLVSNYVVQARIGRFNSDFVLVVEMYEVSSAKIVSRFSGIGNGVGFLLRTVKRESSNFYKSICKKAEKKITKENEKSNQKKKKTSAQDLEKIKGFFSFVNTDICPNRKIKLNSGVNYEYKDPSIGKSSLNVIGKCNSWNQKNGQFNYYFDDILIMKSKFDDDKEIKTDCVSFEGNRRIPQRKCIEHFFRERDD